MKKISNNDYYNLFSRWQASGKTKAINPKNTIKDDQLWQGNKLPILTGIQKTIGRFSGNRPLWLNFDVFKISVNFETAFTARLK